MGARTSSRFASSSEAVSPDPNVNSFVYGVALFTSVYFALTAMIPAA